MDEDLHDEWLNYLCNGGWMGFDDYCEELFRMEKHYMTIKPNVVNVGKPEIVKVREFGVIEGDE